MPPEITKIENASAEPSFYYGLHMAEGVAQYTQAGKVSMVFIGEDCIKQMNATFPGKPVYVGHREVQLESIQRDADGWVTQSFFNPVDGKSWVKFLVVSDRAREALRKGWKLSNAYAIHESRGAGTWHNVPYQQEVAKGSYLHLAIVDNPRYEESIVLTPEEYRAYNERKAAELASLKNSKEPKKMAFKLFSLKKQVVENAADLEGASLELDDGTTVSLADAIKAVKNAKEDDDEKKKKENAVNENSIVNVGDDKMTVKELADKYNALVKKNAADEDEKKKKEAEDKKNKKNATDVSDDRDANKTKTSLLNEEEKKKLAESKENSLSAEDLALKNAQEAARKANETRNFEALKNAREEASKAPVKLQTSMDQLALGRQKYGSGK